MSAGKVGTMDETTLDRQQQEHKEGTMSASKPSSTPASKPKRQIKNRGLERRVEMFALNHPGQTYTAPELAKAMDIDHTGSMTTALINLHRRPDSGVTRTGHGRYTFATAAQQASLAPAPEPAPEPEWLRVPAQTPVLWEQVAELQYAQQAAPHNGHRRVLLQREDGMLAVATLTEVK